MTGAVNNIDALKDWFYSLKKPYFTLKYDTSGNTERIIMRNEDTDDMDKAWDMLQRTVMNQAAVGRARLLVHVHEKGRNNSAIYTAIDIAPGYTQSGGSAQQGIAGFGTQNLQEYIDLRIKNSQLEWENEQLREAANAPTNSFERTMETIAGMPGFADVAKMLAAGLVSRLNPQAAPMVAGMLNGLPADNAAAQTADADDDPAPSADEAAAHERFNNNILSTAAALGTDPLTLSNKLADLVKKNPEAAKTLFQQ